MKHKLSHKKIVYGLKVNRKMDSVTKKLFDVSLLKHKLDSVIKANILCFTFET